MQTDDAKFPRLMGYPGCASCADRRERAFISFVTQRGVTLSNPQWQIVLAVLRLERFSKDVQSFYRQRASGKTFVHSLLEDFFKHEHPSATPTKS